MSPNVAYICTQTGSLVLTIGPHVSSQVSSDAGLGAPAGKLQGIGVEVLLRGTQRSGYLPSPHLQYNGGAPQSAGTWALANNTGTITDTGTIGYTTHAWY